jgi:metal-responsive CopG/Arc/MetJ family transcriptional regulator
MGRPSSPVPIRRRGIRRVAISLPASLLGRLEKERRASGDSRSGFVRKAIESLLTRVEDARRLVAYVEGYRRHPESEAEVEAARAAAAAVLLAEPWE